MGEAHWIGGDHDKCDLPRQRHSCKTIIKAWMRDRRRIVAADHSKHEEQGREHQHASDACDPEDNFRKFHIG
jgi:hypothetical protein